MKDQEEIKKIIENSSIEEIKKIKDFLNLQLRNKNPKNLDKINYNFFNLIKNKLHTGGMSVKRFEILNKLFKNLSHTLINDKLDKLDLEIKSYLKNISLTDINNIPENKYFEVYIKQTNDMEKNNSFLINDSVLNTHNKLSSFKSKNNSNKTLQKNFENIKILESIFEIVNEYDSNIDNYTKLEIIRWHLSGNFEKILEEHILTLSQGLNKNFYKGKMISQYNQLKAKFPSFLIKK